MQFVIQRIAGSDIDKESVVDDAILSIEIIADGVIYSVSVDGDKLDVRVMRGSLAVEPVASNAIRVRGGN